MGNLHKALAIAATVLFVTSGLLVGAASAQTAQRVEKMRDWAVFEAKTSKGAKICWIVSTPKKSLAMRNGKAVRVRRGDIYLMVSVRPADGVKNEVSFLAGYPFKPDSEVKARVGKKVFTMFTEGENAWALSSKDDDAIVAAFRKGADAKIEGVSKRGTKTVDSFSLRGFSAALGSARKRCGMKS